MDRPLQNTKKILITGASGLVGSAVRAHLRLLGHEVFELVRSKGEQSSISPQESAHRIEWDPMHGHIELERLENFDVIIHLAGASIAKFPWSSKRKKELIDSRIKGLKLIHRAIKSLKRPPKKILVASGIGYYGDGKDQVLTDTSPKGSGFLSDLSSEILSTCESFQVPTIDMRFGIVLSEKGGMLFKLLPLFKLGLGAVIGNGSMFMSWIHIDDAVRAICRCAFDPKITTSVNITSKNPVTQKEFAKALARAVKRPLWLRIPKVLFKLAMGREASILLLDSQKAHPSGALEDEIQFSDIDKALDDLLYIDQEKLMHTPTSG